ncbi:MAG: OadG family protein [Methylotetracoccus sp.]
MDTSLPEMLGAGLRLMAVGMGIVFAFLLLLVWVIEQASRLVRRFEAGPPLEGYGVVAVPAVPADEHDLVAAITAAVDLYERELGAEKSVGGGQ